MKRSIKTGKALPKKGVSSKLIGNQYKLDVNKNGKIDSEDLAIIRGEKMAKGGGVSDNLADNLMEEGGARDLKDLSLEDLKFQLKHTTKPNETDRVAYLKKLIEQKSKQYSNGGGIGSKKAKYKVGDMVYSYQNKDYKAPISYTTEISHPNDNVKYKLKLKDGYSNWINEDSLHESKQYGKGGSVTISDLNRMIEEYNAEGRNFELRGAYGYNELWSNGHRLEVGSKKDIYNALIKYRFNEKYAEGGAFLSGGEVHRAESFKKGGNIGSMERRVAEVNALIKKGNEMGVQVTNKNSTWQSPMKYRPFIYSNGVLYEYYAELDLYKHNKGMGSNWEMKTERYKKSGFDGLSAQKQVLTDVARMYRSAINEKEKYGYEDGGMMAKGGSVGTYVPNARIKEVGVEKNGEIKHIDGSKILNGLYLKKGVKFANGGSVEDDLLDFTIPSWALPSLVNADESGLEDSDIEKLTSFIERTIDKYGNANFMLPSEEEMNERFSYRNDIDGTLGANVITMYLKPTKK